MKKTFFISLTYLAAIIIAVGMSMQESANIPDLQAAQSFLIWCFNLGGVFLFAISGVMVGKDPLFGKIAFGFSLIIRGLTYAIIYVHLTGTAVFNQTEAITMVGGNSLILFLEILLFMWHNPRDRVGALEREKEAEWKTWDARWDAREEKHQAEVGHLQAQLDAFRQAFVRVYRLYDPALSLGADLSAEAVPFLVQKIVPAPEPKPRKQRSAKTKGKRRRKRGKKSVEDALSIMRESGSTDYHEFMALTGLAKRTAHSYMKKLREEA